MNCEISLLSFFILERDVVCTVEEHFFCNPARSRTAIAHFAQSYGTKISVIPAGEKWEDGSLRPALEDLIGAGAILSYLDGRRSPEAEAAVAVFNSLKDNLVTALRQCSSGKELLARGFATDIELAAAINSSTCVPLFTHNAYKKQETINLTRP